MNAIEICLRELREAKKAAELANASFGFPTDFVQSVIKQEEGSYLPRGPIAHVDAFVKDRVKLHHRSWIVGPIDRAISLLEAQTELAEILEKLDRALNPHDLKRIAELIEAGRRNEHRL